MYARRENTATLIGMGKRTRLNNSTNARPTIPNNNALERAISFM